MKVHQLKVLNKFADEIAAGKIKFVIRENDNYQKGDYISLTVIAEDSGKEVEHELNTRLCEIVDVLNGWGLKDGFVALGIREAGWGRKYVHIE